MKNLIHIFRMFRVFRLSKLFLVFLMFLKTLGCSHEKKLPPPEQKPYSSPGEKVSEKIEPIVRISFKLCGVLFGLNEGKCTAQQVIFVWGENLQKSDIRLEKYYQGGDKKKAMVVLLVDGNKAKGCVKDIPYPVEIAEPVIIGRGTIPDREALFQVATPEEKAEWENIPEDPTVNQLEIANLSSEDRAELIKFINPNYGIKTSQNSQINLTLQSTCPPFSTLKEKLNLTLFPGQN